MGSRIATRLLRTGFSLEIYDIADVALRMFNMDVGGMITGSPKMMAQACEAIITVLPSAAEVREVAFGWEGLARGFAKGGVLIDMGCSDPMATKKLAEELAGRGIDMVDAPALGTAEDARTGRLTFVVGGPEEVVERCRPIFEALGERILRGGLRTGVDRARAAPHDDLRRPPCRSAAVARQRRPGPLRAQKRDAGLWTNSSGCSQCGKWPASGMTSMRAPAIS